MTSRTFLFLECAHFLVLIPVLLWLLCPIYLYLSTNYEYYSTECYKSALYHGSRSEVQNRDKRELVFGWNRLRDCTHYQ